MIPSKIIKLHPPSSVSLTHHFGQCGDDLPQRGQRLVDVGALLQPGALGAGGVCPFRARQVHQRDLADLHGEGSDRDASDA